MSLTPGDVLSFTIFTTSKFRLVLARRTPTLLQAFKTQEYPEREHSEKYRLRFLSNVDPVDVRRTLYDLDPEETLVVVISKTFTTAETMLNARYTVSQDLFLRLFFCFRMSWPFYHPLIKKSCLLTGPVDCVHISGPVGIIRTASDGA